MQPIMIPKNVTHVLHCQHDLDVHLLFCVDLELHITSSRGRVNLDFSCRSSLMGTTLCAAPTKNMSFQQIIIHALQCQHDLDVHLLFYVDLDLHITSSRGRV